ncbi:unnamed protein product [Larinioides sclopetarius]|uniref:Cns1/TTC4 wheel domain-containing protein n=2 Tax=Larinioides sclopetarius TaxID=280406 RepID=A0AAV2ASS7_9ARAC
MADSQPKSSGFEPWNPDRWEEEMETHPVFRTQPLKEGEELPPLIEALQNLKYDPEENTAEELAEAYKFDGNENFRRKKYRWAVDNYTKALEIKCKNDILNAQLYANRATANYYIGNYKKALRDSEESRKLKPDHSKALHRGALCCFQLQEWSDCIAWCDEGLNVSPDDKTLVELKNKAEEEKKIAQRNKRKALVLETKRKKELEEVKSAIQERGICLAEDNIAECERPIHPALTDAMVHLSAGRLVWPVIFIYPEYGTTDYIKEFSEDSRFVDHLNIMFDPGNLPEWDTNHEYIAENLQLYFTRENLLVPFDKTKMLGEILTHNRYVVHGLTPCFAVTVRGSDFDRMFRERHTVLSL